MADQMSTEASRQEFILRRKFRGPDDRDWEVREVPLPSYDRRGGNCLIFESLDVIRRIREVPVDWPLWSDEDLYALSMGLSD